MKVTSKIKYLRISPRKVRIVADLVRGLEVNKALDQLKFINKWAARPIEKIIKSGVANAEHNYELDKSNLKISEIRVDEGSSLHRWLPRAHGRATPIRKRTCHVNLTLVEINDSGKKGAKKQEIEAPVKLSAKPKEEDSGLKLEKKDEQPEKKIKSDTKKDIESEKGDKIVDPRLEGKGGHAKIEGKKGRGFVSKFFQRKSG